MTVKNLESYVPKQVVALNAEDAVRLPATIPANAGDIGAGQVMGVRTADKLLLPVRRAVITADAADNVKTVTVGVANVGKFKVGDTVAWRTLADATAHNMGAVTAVDAVAGTVTFTNVTGAAITKDVTYLYVMDGTEVAKAVMQYSVLNDAAIQGVSPYVSGMFYEDQLLGLDAIAISDLGARRSLGGVLIVPC
jgi:hypothetical protein